MTKHVTTNGHADADALRCIAKDLLRVADDLAARPGPVPGRGAALREIVAEAVRVSNRLEADR